MCFFSFGALLISNSDSSRNFTQTAVLQASKNALAPNLRSIVFFVRYRCSRKKHALGKFDAKAFFEAWSTASYVKFREESENLRSKVAQNYKKKLQFSSFQKCQNFEFSDFSKICTNLDFFKQFWTIFDLKFELLAKFHVGCSAPGLKRRLGDIFDFFLNF